MGTSRAKTSLTVGGAFPTLIAIITMFYVGGIAGWQGDIVTALCLTGFVLLGVGATFLGGRLLSRTLLKGEPSAFTLELPPFRMPQVGKVILRSILDRTLYVLGRAAAIAAPAGMLIWLLANLQADGVSLFAHIARSLSPVARPFGMDGVLLGAFVLGLPANEIVLPVAVMAYSSGSSVSSLGSLESARLLLLQNGWSLRTAICAGLFMLLHWPCSTTLLTIRKETGSWGWTLLSALLPTAFGLALCFLVNALLTWLGI